MLDAKLLADAFVRAYTGHGLPVEKPRPNRPQGRDWSIFGYLLWFRRAA